MARRHKRRKRQSQSRAVPSAVIIFFIGLSVGIVGFWCCVKLINSPLIASIFVEKNQSNISLDRSESGTALNTSVTRVVPSDLSPGYYRPSSIVTKSVEKPSIKNSEVRVRPIVTRTKAPKIVIVIDDIGYHDQLKNELFSTGVPLTFAILPQVNYSTFFSREGKKRGYEVILHQPLEPEGELSESDPGMIATHMDKELVKRILNRNLQTVPDAVGINNHMGSKATQNAKLMRWILEELKSKKMIFLDSMTSNHSIAWVTAQSLDVPNIKRNVFLDNEDDPKYIENQIWHLVEEAKINGRAIGIGHYRKNTLSVIKKLGPKIRKQGVEIVSLGDLVKQ